MEKKPLQVTELMLPAGNFTGTGTMTPLRKASPLNLIGRLVIQLLVAASKAVVATVVLLDRLMVALGTFTV